MQRASIEAGISVMRLYRRSRATKLFMYLSIYCALFYFLRDLSTTYYLPNLENISLLFNSIPSITITRYSRYPVYEYTSLYRTLASSAFETSFENQLLAVEAVLRSNLPPSEQNLVANRTIWQLATQDLAQTYSSWITQWRLNNPDWKHHLLHPSALSPAILAPFENIPEIATAVAVAGDIDEDVRDDLLKYLLLWYYGGLYVDVDTWNRVALDNCLPFTAALEGRENTSLVIGVDIDEPYYSPRTLKTLRWNRGFAFSTATIWAPKRFDPIVRKAIVRTISHVRVHSALLEHRSWRSRLRLSSGVGRRGVDYASEISGRGMFTDIVLEVLSASLAEDHELRDCDAGLESRVSWKKFRRLKEVLWIDSDQGKEDEGGEKPIDGTGRRDVDMKGLAVLPINVWSSGQNHSGSGSMDSEDACVNHVYDLKPQQEREWKDKIFE